jgi:hypothetical protein
LPAIGPLGLMAGGREDHFTDSRDLYVLVQGNEWAHVDALDPDADHRSGWRLGCAVPRLSADVALQETARSDRVKGFINSSWLAE